MWKNSAWVQFGHKSFLQMLKDLGKSSPDASTGSAQSHGNTISSATLNPNLPERKLSCHDIPAPNKIAEFWEMVFRNKLSTIVLLTEKMKGRKEVHKNFSSVLHGTIVASEES